MTVINDSDGAIKVAYRILNSLLEGRQLHCELAEAAALTAREALIGLGQDLLGKFCEIYKEELPTMSEAEIRRLIARDCHRRREWARLWAEQPPTAPPPLPSSPPSSSVKPPVVSCPPVTPAMPGTPAAAPDVAGLELGADFVPYTPDFQPAYPAAAWPVWFTQWFAAQRGSLAKTFTVLQILGRTGDPYLTRVMQTAGQLLDLKGGGIYRSADQLEELGLIQREQVLWKRIKPHLVMLTPRGIEAYRLLFGHDPAPQTLQLALARHKSATHVYLILETQRHLEAAGYVVEALPAALATSQGRYEPDLLAHLDGETLYIEAEVKTHKDLRPGGPRQEKWSRYWDVTGGQLYLAVVDGPGQKSLLSELRYWAQQLGLRGQVGFLQAGERELAAQGGDIWEHFSLG